MLKKVNDVKMIIITIFIMMFMVGCVSTGTTSNKSVIDSSYKVLKTTQIAYDNAMKATQEAYLKGLVTSEEREKVRVMGTDFVKAYKVLARVLEMYADGEKSPITIEQATANFVEINFKLMRFVGEVVNR